MSAGGDELVGAGQECADFQALEVGALADQETAPGERLVVGWRPGTVPPEQATELAFLMADLLKAERATRAKPLPA